MSTVRVVNPPAISSPAYPSATAIRVWAGMDGEMTGSSKTPFFFRDFQLIQIGVAFGLEPQDLFVSDIGYDKWNQTDEAMEVNKFTPERIKAGPKASAVDMKLVSWVYERVSVPPSQRILLIPVGWNVAGFDLPFVRYYLPEFSKLVWYRSVDLNSVVFTAAEVTGRSYDKIKKSAKRYAVRALKREMQWHDAGYDAAASLAAWYYLQQLFGVVTDDATLPTTKL